MIDAANTARLVAAKKQTDAPVGAKFIDQTNAAFGVTKRDQRLAQHPNSHRRAVRLADFTGQHERRPEAAHESAHRRARIRLGQIVVFLRT